MRLPGSCLSPRLGRVCSRINLRPPRVASLQGGVSGGGRARRGIARGAGQGGGDSGGAGRGCCVRRRSRLRKDEGLRSPRRSRESRAPAPPPPRPRRTGLIVRGQGRASRSSADPRQVWPHRPGCRRPHHVRGRLHGLRSCPVSGFHLQPHRGTGAWGRSGHRATATT